MAACLSVVPTAISSYLPPLVARQIWAQPHERRRLVFTVFRACQIAWAIDAVGEVPIFRDGRMHVLNRDAPGWASIVALHDALVTVHPDILPILCYVDDSAEPIVVKLPRDPDEEFTS